MNENNLTKLLEQLHTELSKTEAIDERGRELLRTLNSDIRTLLDRSEGENADDTMLERLQDTIDHFEATHPSLTTTLSSLLTVLNNAGI